jgi:hypothetical protein
VTRVKSLSQASSGRSIVHEVEMQLVVIGELKKYTKAHDPEKDAGPCAASSVSLEVAAYGGLAYGWTPGKFGTDKL